MGYSQKIYTAIKSYFSSSSSLVGIEIFVWRRIEVYKWQLYAWSWKNDSIRWRPFLSPTTTTINDNNDNTASSRRHEKHFFFLKKSYISGGRSWQKTTTHSQPQQNFLFAHTEYCVIVVLLLCQFTFTTHTLSN